MSAGLAPLCSVVLQPGPGDTATYSCSLTAAQLTAGSYTNVQVVYIPAASSSSNPNVAYLAPASPASAPAPDSFTVSKATPAITWANPAAIVYGTPLGSTQLDATASVAGAAVNPFAYTPAAGTVLAPGSSQALKVTFTPADTTDYTTATATVDIDVTTLACAATGTSGALTIGAGQAGCVSTGGTVQGNLTVSPHGALFMNGGTISGSLTATGATAISLCGVTIKGNLTITGSTGPVIVGPPGCTNTIAGSVVIENNTGGVTYAGNTAKDSLTLTGNSGGFNYTASANTTGGTVTVKTNT